MEFYTKYQRNTKTTRREEDEGKKMRNAKEKRKCVVRVSTLKERAKSVCFCLLPARCLLLPAASCCLVFGNFLGWEAGRPMPAGGGTKAVRNH
jgi:hypothetical protein